MDFNTGGGSGRSDDRPLYGGESGGTTRGPAPGPAGGSGGEFNLQDPVNSFVETARRVVLDPVGFFRGIPRRGDFVNPLVFAVICAVIYGVLLGIINFLVTLAFLGDPDFGVGAAIGGLIYSIISAPILVVLSLFIGGGIYHLLVLLLVRPNNAGFEATFRVFAYISALLLIAWLVAVPLLGILIYLIVLVYAIYLSIVGIREVHSTTTGTAALIVLIPTVVFILFLILLVVLVGAALFFGAQQV
jgi:hypothetical protein